MAALKNFAVAALAALTLGGAALGTAAPAEASPYKKGLHLKAVPAGYHGHGYGYHGYGKHYGYGAPVAAGLIGGLALGAVAASASPVYVAASDCYTVRRRFVNAYGDVYVRRERVCD